MSDSAIYEEAKNIALRAIGEVKALISSASSDADMVFAVMALNELQQAALDAARAEIDRLNAELAAARAELARLKEGNE